MRYINLCLLSFLFIMLFIELPAHTLSITMEEGGPSSLSFDHDLFMVRSHNRKTELLLRAGELLSIGKPSYSGLLHSLFIPDSRSFTRAYAPSKISLTPTTVDGDVACSTGFTEGTFSLNGFYIVEENTDSIGLIGRLQEKGEALALTRDDLLLYGIRWSEKHLLDFRYLMKTSAYRRTETLSQVSHTFRFRDLQIDMAQKTITEGFDKRKEAALKIARYFKAGTDQDWFDCYLRWKESSWYREALTYDQRYERSLRQQFHAELGLLSIEHIRDYEFRAENLLECREELVEQTRYSIILEPFKISLKMRFSFSHGIWETEHEIITCYENQPLKVSISTGIQEGEKKFSVGISYSSDALLIKRKLSDTGDSLEIAYEW